MTRLRILTGADIEAAHGLSQSAGWNQTQTDWRQTLALSPTRCFAAVAYNRVVGTVFAIKYGSSFGFIGMMLVHPQYKRQGIGKMLMLQAMDALSDCDVIRLDATAEGRALYLPLGFHDETSITRMLYTGPSKPLTANAQPLAASDLEEVCDYDERIFRADRSPVLRAIYKSAHGAWCLKAGGDVTGYCFARPGERYAHVGPLVAANTADAQQLLFTAMASLPVPLVLDAPDANTEWKELLIRQEYSEHRKFVRMKYGRGSVPADLEKQFAIAGPEYG